MGSSKKHKEKRDRKKHKKGRSRSREREHKKSHKSSSRKEKRKSPERGSSEYELDIADERKREETSHKEYFQHNKYSEKSPVLCKEPSPDEDFDIDKLLESKLPEANVKRSSKKRIREDVLEEFRKRQNIGRSDVSEESRKHQIIVKEEDNLEEFKKRQNSRNEDTPEKFVNRLPGAKLSYSPQPGPSHTEIEIPFINDITIKQEPLDDSFPEEPVKERTEPQLSLSISETNKIRAKLGLRPLDVRKPADVQKPVDVRKPVDIHKSANVRKPVDERKPIDEPPPERTEPQLSLSINETNKLRAKLGLKPLDVGSEIPGLADENVEKEPSKPTEIFVKTENIRDIKKTEAIREKLKVIKEKRAIEEKLKKTKGVADTDSDEESAADWVIKHQKLLKEKERAEKRAKLLEEMDEEFGVGALVEEEFQKDKAYTSHNLKGLTIGHDVGVFKEGTPVILTLKDKGVLEEEEDILENVNILDNEKYAKNVEVKKKRPEYRPYDEPEYDEFGIVKKKNLLSKYDEEIEGEKKKSFKIGSDVSHPSYSTREQELELIRMKLKQQNKMSLEMPELRLAHEYYTPEDMVQFKKPKKKKKIRKGGRLKADDLLPDVEDSERDYGSRKKKRIPSDVPFSTDSYEIDVPEADSDLTSVVIDEDQAENELYSALNKAKKLKQRKIQSTAPEKVLEILNKTNAPGGESSAHTKGVNIELNSVAEFCRTLGEIPTYGMSGNRDEEADDLMDLERELLEEKQKQELEAQNRGAWNEVDIDEKPAEISIRENEPILEEEPDINLGVAGALNLAMKKGYLDKDGKKARDTPRSSQLAAQSYTIEEKFYEDDKFGKRDRYTGPVQEFREKSHYKPDVKLEYIDDSGRLLTAKEAFRYLSHKFHGKGPGKNKVDKRMKKLEQDTRLKQMSSTDTPLNTVKLLQAKQKETQSPYIVLSGGNKTLTQTMISKSKM